MNSTSARFFSENAVFQVLFLAMLLFCYFPSQQASAQIQTNVALNKAYSLHPKPNYKLCSDDRDYIQLTDGKKNGSDWQKKSTVGWRPSSYPEVVIDLGQEVLGDEIKIYTVGGGRADVFLPYAVYITISSDGKTFYPGGYIDNYDVNETQKEKIPKTLTIPLNGTKGRYIKVLFSVNGYFLFMDEIEVFGKKPDSPNKKKIPRLPVKNEIFFERLSYFEQCQRMLQALVVSMSSSAMAQEGGLKTKINACRSKLSGLSIDSLLGTAILALTHEVDILRAQVLRQRYGRDYIVKLADPAEMLLESTLDLSLESGSMVMNIETAGARFAYGAVNVSNCGSAPLKLSAGLSPVSGSSGQVIEMKILDLRRAVYVYSKGIGNVADPLVLYDGPFDINPGQTVQLWVDVDTKGLPAGDYESVLELSATGTDQTEKISICIKTEDPSNTVRDINVCLWAYLDIKPLSALNQYDVSQDLKDNYTNVAVMHPLELPPPDKSGALDFSHFDRVLEASDYASQYLLFLAFTEYGKDNGKFGKWMSADWKKRFSSWLKLVVKRLRSKGIDYDDFAIYPFDETLCDAFYDLARFIKSVDKKIRVFANSFGDGPGDYKRFQSLIDIWCLHIRYCRWHPGWFKQIKSYGKPVWVYATDGPGKANDPVGYYKEIIDFADKNNLQGVGFWAYVDPVMDSTWNDWEMAGTSYGVVYLNPDDHNYRSNEKLIPSRRWRVWRGLIENFMNGKSVAQ